MLVMSKGGLSCGQAETYYEEKYSRDDYYSENRRITGQWFGRAAAALGLSGEVRHADFAALLRAADPRTGAVLVNHAHGRSERRAGWDATFNAPKSVSVQALIGEDSRLIAAHRRAVERALRELEEYALARRRHGSEWVVTANIAAARFEHIAARPAAGARDRYGPDPHLHTHVVVMNLTWRVDGAWRSLDPVEIYRSQTFATVVYRAELAQQVQRLGYCIELTGADGRWELEGYNREQVMAFSRRREDIEQKLKELGLDGAAAAQIAAHQTRGAKEHRDEQNLKAEWRERAAAIGIQPKALVSQARARGPAPDKAQATVEEAVRYGAEHHNEREAVLDRRALETAALQHSMGDIVLDQVRRQSTREVAAGRLIPIAGNFRRPQGAYTTPAMIGYESDNLEMMRAGKGRAEPLAGPAEVRTWAASRRLLPDQARVAEIILSSCDWLSAIEGRAGATKTTTVAAIRELAEERGYTVRGFGPTTGSVKALSEAGVPARTIASLIENPLPERSRKELWIIDEASLLPARQVNRLLHQAQDNAVERVVFVGDRRQHHAIEAGAPFKQMIEAGMQTARLDIIRRQRDPELRATVALAAQARITEAVDELEGQGRIRAIADREERHRAIAHDYLTAHQAGQRTLVVSPANDERRALNTAIRELLIEHGAVAAQGHEHTILVGRDLTRVQGRRAQNYAPGEIVRFRRGSQQLGLAGGSCARVEAVDREHNRVTVRTGDERLVTYNPARLSATELFREEQRMIAAGERIQFRAPARELKLANGEFATITGVERDGVNLRTDQGRELKVNLKQLAHIDYGYASTSHAAQGATVDRVLVNIDTSRSAELVNRKQFYVSLSRARFDARVYADDRAALARAAGRNREKSLALEALGHKDLRSSIRPDIQIVTPRERITRPEQTQRPSQGTRMRI